MSPTITPERIPLLALPWVSLENRTALPQEAAIYFVIDTRTCTVLYIGQTQNLLTRWKGHPRISQAKDLWYCRIAWLSVSEPALLKPIEAACIAYFAPAWNCSYAWSRRKGAGRPVIERSRAYGVTFYTLTCKRCGHAWVPRKAPVMLCAKCKSPYWNTPRQKATDGHPGPDPNPDGTAPACPTAAR